MKLLFINRVYPPAEGSTGQLLAEIAPQFVKRGWDVTVVTSGPASAPASEMLAGVRVERVRGLPFSRAAHWRRALSYLCLYPALLWRVLRLPRADVVVTLTDPPLQLVLGPLIKWLKGGRLVHWVQDFYPEIAEELGVIKPAGFLAGLCRRISTWALKRYDRVIAIGECMKQRLLDRGVAESAIRVSINWAPAATGGVARSSNAFRIAQDFGDRFLVVYAGNLGLAHCFEAIVDAAADLKTYRPDILFLFVGNGPRLPWLKRQVIALDLPNILFLPYQPLSQLRPIMTAADMHIATMRENVWGLMVPSKVYGILAAGRPCLFLGPTRCEVSRTIEEFKCGEVLARASGPDLATALCAWADDPERLRAAGLNAHRFAKSAGLAEAVRRLEEILRQVALTDRDSGEPSAGSVSLPALPAADSSVFPAPQHAPSKTQK
jgi:colanic acid biosynthesis glycosyl transferase WcaI